MSLPCYSVDGRKQTSHKVADQLFDCKINHQLLKLAYHHHLAQTRVNLAKTKNRSMVRGGGRKPWQQKGTGKARAGTIRSPLWRGGGIVFGPRGIENYTFKINRKAKTLALRQALTLNKEQLIVLQEFPQDGKTANLAKLLYKTLKLNRRILLIDSQATPEIKRASANLAEVELIDVSYLNVFRILNADHLIISKTALEEIETKFDLKQTTGVKA